MQELNFRVASVEDAPFIAKCVTKVAEGVVEMLLEGFLNSIDPWQILTMVLQDSSQALSYKNALIAELLNSPQGLLLAYEAKDQVIPPLMRTLLPKERLEPLEEALTCVWEDSLYINTLWVAEDQRGKGLAWVLMDYAKTWAKSLELSRLSLMVLKDNLRAQTFYERQGFKFISAIKLPPRLSDLHGGALLLGCEL
ncbi:MAG: GNAT family N-acetyltransferase [Desulfovibrionaceae bacterium]|nr:GNAT family N-acetyltransferase [Desulfovibrionaceae bacterium]